MSAPLFSGTVHFIHPTFVTPGGTFTFSAADMQTMIQYAQHAIVPILEMVHQEYGPSTTVISPTTIDYTAHMSAATFSDSDLQGWVNDILSTNGLDPSTTLIAVPCPSGIDDDSGYVVANGGYHYIAHRPYPFCRIIWTGPSLGEQVDP